MHMLFQGILLLLAGLGLLLQTALAQSELDPYELQDGESIKLSGQVDSVTSDSFVLDFGGGLIVVEMEPDERAADEYELSPGDKVTITGNIDENFFESKVIEASTLYVEKLGRRFYAGPETTVETGITTVQMETDPSVIVVQGEVSAIGQNSFTLNTDQRRIRVNLAEIENSPLDQPAGLGLSVGDVVSVTGKVNSNFFEGREIMAEIVAPLP